MVVLVALALAACSRGKPLSEYCTGARCHDAVSAELDAVNGARARVLRGGGCGQLESGRCGAFTYVKTSDGYLRVEEYFDADGRLSGVRYRSDAKDDRRYGEVPDCAPRGPVDLCVKAMEGLAVAGGTLEIASRSQVLVDGERFVPSGALPSVALDAGQHALELELGPERLRCEITVAGRSTLSITALPEGVSGTAQHQPLAPGLTVELGARQDLLLEAQHDGGAPLRATLRFTPRYGSAR